MESEPEDAGLSHTGPLSRGIFSSRKSVGRCLTLRAQRVPVSSICDDNQSGDEDSRMDTATSTNGSATIGTVSAILTASRRSERNPSDGPPTADSCPDKENTAGRRMAHPCDLLTPLPRRTGPPPPADRTPRQPLSRIDTPCKEPVPPQPTAASAVKRPFVFGEPSTERRPSLQHASRSHSSLAAAERPTPGLSRGLSEGRLPSAGPLRGSLPVLTERPSESTPPEQRVTPLNQSGSAPAAGPTARVSPAMCAAAGTPRPVTSGQSQNPRYDGYVTPHRLVPDQDVGERQVPNAAGGGLSQPAVSWSLDRRTVCHTRYRSAAPGGGREQYAARSGADCHSVVHHIPAVSRADVVDGHGPQRTASCREPAGRLPQQEWPAASGAGRTQYSTIPTTGQGPLSSHQPPPAAVMSRGADGPRPASALTAASVSAGQSRLGLPAAAAMVASSTTVVSASSVHISSLVQSEFGSGLSASSAVPPRLPLGTAGTPSGQHGTSRPPPPPPPSQADCGTQTEESTSTTMPPPPAEVFFGKRQLRTLTVNQHDYILMKQIGRGGSSKVYQVFDAKMRSLAIKQVFLENTDPATASGYKNEIALLRSLQHSDRVVRLIDYEHRASRQMLYIVMEQGDTDLSSLMRSYTRLNEVDANLCKFFWCEMLRCVDVIHKENIVHSDLKPSNFLMVAGRLKLIDFGIASQIQSDCTSIIKDAQVGTFNYMSPEAIEAQQVTRNGASQTAIKISRRSDVWSLGCILYNFVYGITPFGHIKQVLGKLVAIVDPKYDIEFPPVSDCHLLAVLRGCLQRDPYQRPSIEQLLSDPYLTGCRCQCQK